VNDFRDADELVAFHPVLRNGRTVTRRAVRGKGLRNNARRWECFRHTIIIFHIHAPSLGRGVGHPLSYPLECE